MSHDAYTAQPIASGMWKFKESVTATRLAAVARGWMMGVNGDNYLDLHIRSCGKDQLGIGFQYKLFPDDVEVSEQAWKRRHGKFFHRMKDQLERMFPDDFVGFDVSSSTWIVK